MRSVPWRGFPAKPSTWTTERWRSFGGLLPSGEWRYVGGPDRPIRRAEADEVRSAAHGANITRRLPLPDDQQNRTSAQRSSVG